MINLILNLIEKSLETDEKEKPIYANLSEEDLKTISSKVWFDMLLTFLTFLA